MDIEKIIREYISGVMHLSLGTCENNRPWVSEVHFCFDEDLNLYFRSLSDRRHSREIAANTFVAGNIVEQHGLDLRPRGVYFEGKAEMLQFVNEDNVAYKSYCERFNTDKRILEDADNEDGHKFYKITVEMYYVFDGRESNPSQKYELAWHGGKRRRFF